MSNTQSQQLMVEWHSINWRKLERSVYKLQKRIYQASARGDVKANRHHSRKVKGSSNRERARKNLARAHEDIVNRRTDWFWKLAHSLTNRFDVLCFETLNLKGMKRLWGRKVSDLALRDFLDILEWVALKKGKLVVYIDQWYPSSKTCFNCGHILESLDLSVRRWRCPSCLSVNDRDENASLNIKRVESSTLGVGDVRQSQTAISV
ncbi:RNA-guided endonuclease InsQ/TnpB family protein [Nostoc sp.]|uniref:RNA-guided endonuclease InsQ/TnpB family protein n=1 Tax=Nostoc sp. TaxID=1180 RepID=UPI002FF4C21B